MLDLALHTVVAEAREGTADFDAVDSGDHNTSGPGRTKHSVALQATREFTAQIKNSFGVLPFQSVANGIFTQRANAFVQSNFLTFRFDSVQSWKLASGSQKTASKIFFPLCRGDWRRSGKVPTLAEKLNTLSR
jgi:hypothetical protein